MPRPCAWRSPTSAVDMFVTRVAAALEQERRTIAVILEESHSSIITELSDQLGKGKGFLGAAAGFPDLGPEIGERDALIHPTDGDCYVSEASLEPLVKHDGKDAEAFGNAKDCQALVTLGEDTAVLSFDLSKSNTIQREKPVPPPIQTELSGDDAKDLRGSALRGSALRGSALRGSALGSRTSDALMSAGPSNPRSSGGRSPHSQKRKKSIVAAGGEVVTRELIIRRLHAKLGYTGPGERLHADHLHASLEALTLATFDCTHVRILVKALRLALNPMECTTTAGSGNGSIVVASSIHTGWSALRASNRAVDSSDRDYTIAFHDFVEIMLLDDAQMIEMIGEEYLEQVKTVRNILLASDANCLVAELMHLRVDDITRPLPAATLLDYIEPIIGATIITNAILIGLQTIPSIAQHSSMLVFEVGITLLFFMEFIAKLRHSGRKLHFMGPDWYWNWFDLLIIILCCVDISLMVVFDGEFDTSAMTILRMARLTRLARLARIFRISWLSELNLVCKGLLGGLRTLFWAVVLLFFIMYVVAVMLTMTIGSGGPSDDLEFERLREDEFSTLPRSAFTTFRCLLIVECAAESGKPILNLVTERYGAIVPVCYIFLFVTVSIGLMNLIMAIYIESTLREAKNTEEHNKDMRHRESLRVALQLKRFLLKVCSLQIGYHSNMTEHEVRNILEGKGLKKMVHDNIDANLDITKEVFLMAIHDPEVQKIMDDLDLPLERAQLFDALDADGSGELKPTELLNGLLKVRGDSTRSDVAALLLATRALQSKLDIMESQFDERLEQLVDKHNQELSMLERIRGHLGVTGFLERAKTTSVTQAGWRSRSSLGEH